MTETEMEKDAGGIGLAYQDDDSTDVPVQANEVIVQKGQRGDRECVFVDVAVVQSIKNKRKEVVDESEDEDDTMLQYCSADEDNSTGHRIPAFGIDDDDE